MWWISMPIIKVCLMFRASLLMACACLGNRDHVTRAVFDVVSGLCIGFIDIES